MNIFCTWNPKVILNSKKVPSLQDYNGIPAMYVNWESFYLSHLLAHELDELLFFLHELKLCIVFIHCFHSLFQSFDIWSLLIGLTFLKLQWHFLRYLSKYRPISLCVPTWNLKFRRRKTISNVFGCTALYIMSVYFSLWSGNMACEAQRAYERSVTIFVYCANSLLYLAKKKNKNNKNQTDGICYYF